MLRIFSFLISFFLMLNMSVYADFSDEIPLLKEKEEKNTMKSVGTEKKSTKESSKEPLKNPAPALEKETKSQNQNTSSSYPHNNMAPVYFQGKKGNFSKKTGILNLIGNVFITQDNTNLTANEAQIFSYQNAFPLSGSRQIQKALAKGNVKILKKSSSQMPEVRTESDEVEFLVQERIIILKGRAKVWREDEYLYANIIQLFLETGEVRISEPQALIDPRATKLKEKE